MKSSFFVIIALTLSLCVGGQAFSADNPKSKKTLNDFYTTERVTKMSDEIKQRLSEASRNPDFVRNELMKHYYEIELQIKLHGDQILFEFEHGIEITDHDKAFQNIGTEREHFRHLKELQVKILGILAALPPPVQKATVPAK
jgi:hypothetical protein